MMKLLFVIDNLGSGGAQRQMVSLAIGLQEQKNQVEFFVYHPHISHFSRELSEAGIRVHAYSKRNRFSLGVVLALRRVIVTSKRDCILSFLDTPNFYCELLKACTLHKSPLIVSERVGFAATPIAKRTRFWRQFHRFADHITVNSHYQENRMVTEFPWMMDKISTIYNGVDFRRYFPNPIRAIHVKQSANLVALGTIIPRKNTLGLVRALGLCSENIRSQITINWAGKSDTSRSGIEYRSLVEREIDSLGLRENWRWLGERQDIDVLLREYDALVHPSFLEGLPNAICEALASGLPILASSVCDHPILVEDGVNGLLFDPNDPAEISRSLSQFVNLPQTQREEMSLASIETARRLLSFDRYIDAYDKLFRQVIRSRSHE